MENTNNFVRVAISNPMMLMVRGQRSVNKFFRFVRQSTHSVASCSIWNLWVASQWPASRNLGNYPDTDMDRGESMDSGGLGVGVGGGGAAGGGNLIMGWTFPHCAFFVSDVPSLKWRPSPHHHHQFSESKYLLLRPATHHEDIWPARSIPNGAPFVIAS